MKKWILFIVLFYFFQTSISIAQTEEIYPLEKGIYLVVGAFQNKTNALNFRNKLKSEGEDAQVSYSSKTMYNYVHIQTFLTFDEAVANVMPTRRNTQHTKAWVLVYFPKVEAETNSSINTSEEVTNRTDNSGKTTEGTNVTKANIDNQSEIESKLEGSNIKNEKLDIPVYNADHFKTTKNQYKFIFNTFNFVTESSVNGNVNVIDPDRLKLVRSVKAHELIYVNNPNNQSNSLEFIAEIFGYKKAQHDVNLSGKITGDLAAFMHVSGDTLFVDFPLKRYDKGDVVIMYNVFFFKDAAVMKQESQFELNSLLDLLNEQQDYKIKISGHTNGNAGGKIIEIDDDVAEYFSLNQATKESNGSAKKLSLKRAEIIQKYLLNNGISADRMQVEGWGGKNPIYDKFDRLASKNVRVEIEILKE